MPTVFISGAEAGTGLALAHHYADLGWSLLLANRRPLKAADFAAFGPEMSEFRYDPRKDDSAADIAARLAGRPIDLVILAAGSGRNSGATQISRDPAGIEELMPEAFEEEMLLHAWAPLHLATLLCANLKLGSGRLLVGLADGAGATGSYAGPAGYGLRAGAAAMNQMWRNLAVEWRGWGATCITLDAAAPAQRLIDRIGAARPDISGAVLWSGEAA